MRNCQFAFPNAWCRRGCEGLLTLAPLRRLHAMGLCALLLGLGALQCPVLAQLPANAEASLKGRLALSLARFAQWPVSGISGDPLRLCLAHRDPSVARAFAELEGKVINGRLVQLVKAPPVASCHVLFVHATAERAGELLRAAAGSAILTIGDGEGFLALGGMVELVSLNDALRFDVNLGAFRAAKMSLSSQALKLARQVRE